MDLVYFVKHSDVNEDLRYSLRSIDKFVPFDNVWIVGYKPTWVQNVKYLPVPQTGTKHQNQTNNLLALCKCEEISDDFVLMNDDFFAIKPVRDLEESVEICLGSLDKAVQEHNKSVGKWHKAFKHVYQLLESMGVEKPYYNFESHTPLKMNRHKMLEVLNHPKVKQFIKSPKVLHRRTLYRNVYHLKCRVLPTDVKISPTKDNTLERIKVCDWLSVYDNQVGSSKFKELNNLLHTLFPEPCKYEDLNIKPFETKVYRTGIMVLAKSVADQQMKEQTTRNKKPRFGSKKK